MRTAHDNGDPYDLESLLSSFWMRMKTLAEFAGELEPRPGEKADYRIETLVNAIQLLHEDWEVFQRAAEEWDRREHPESYYPPLPKQAGAA